MYTQCFIVSFIIIKATVSAACEYVLSIWCWTTTLLRSCLCEISFRQINWLIDWLIDWLVDWLKVHDTAIEYIQQIRNREKQIIEELQNIYGPDCMQQLANKKELLAQVQHKFFSEYRPLHVSKVAVQK